MAYIRKSSWQNGHPMSYLCPDGKSQVTVEYQDGVPIRVESIVISTQHTSAVTQNTIQQDMMEYVINAVIPQSLLDSSTQILVNPAGQFIIGGPLSDTGMTVRKIIVDSYGGIAHHGGGAFSGKDPTKVDRSAAYAARHIAKNIVAAEVATRCEVQIAYAIGVAHPVAINVDTFGTGKISDEQIAGLILKNFDLRPASIIDRLQLRRPIYRATATYGHFGREDIDMSWEHLDAVDVLKTATSVLPHYAKSF